MPKIDKAQLMKFYVLKQFIQQGPLTVQVTGDCMRQVIPVDSQVRLEAKRIYWPGDIVAFKRGVDQIVSHRYLGYLPGRNGWLAVTRADNAPHADAPVRFSDLLGHVTHINGSPWRPGPMERIRALGGWCSAVFSAIVNRGRRAANLLKDT